MNNMKERIQELKMKTSMWYDENIPEQWSYESGYGETWENKFAELLIKECCSIVMADKVISWADSIRICDNIKEEFGVEK